jgi:type I restriction enzyme S subunit
MNKAKVLPQGWSEFKLENIVRKEKKIRYGIVQTGENIIDGIPCLRVVDLETKKTDLNKLIKTSNKINKQYEDCILEENDIVLALRGKIGKGLLINKDLLGINITRGLARISCKNDFYPLFIYYQLQAFHVKKDLWLQVNGTSLKEIPINGLKKVRIWSPTNLSEQRKIAQILSTWDKAIEKTEQLIQAKTQLKKGQMQQLLTGKKRFREFIITNEKQNSKVGLIPKDWQIKKLHEIAKFSNGKAHENYIVENGNYFVVNSKFISTEGKVVKRSNECLSPLNTGDIAIVMSDIPQGAALAKCYFITVDNKYTLNQRIGCINPYNADNQFVYLILNRNKFYLKFDDGVSQTNLRKDEVIECPIPLPSLKEQRKITSTLNLIQNEINLLQNNLELLITQKKGLMQKLLTGEVRVKID